MSFSRLTLTRTAAFPRILVRSTSHPSRRAASATPLLLHLLLPRRPPPLPPLIRKFTTSPRPAPEWAKVDEEAEGEEEPTEPTPGRNVLIAFLLIAIPIFTLSNLHRITPALVTREEVLSTLPRSTTTTTRQPTPQQIITYIHTHRPDLIRLFQISQTTRKHTTLTPSTFFFNNNTTFPKQWWTIPAYAFNHGSIVHFFCCYMGLKAFVEPLSSTYGDRRVAAMFLAGAVLSGVTVVGYELATNPYARGGSSSSGGRRGRDGDDDRYLARARTVHVGSSGAVLALGTVTAIVKPWMRLGLMFIPVDFPIRGLMASMAAFDLVGIFGVDYGLGISHIGHLGGYLAGLVLYAVWVRKLPPYRSYRYNFGNGK